MSDQVKFEEEEILVDQASQISRQSALTNIIIKTGLVKTESQATNILIAIMVVCLLLTLYVISQYLI